MLWLFWVPLGIVAAEYVLYHAALFAVRRRALPTATVSDWPEVTILIPAFNEERTLADKIANLLAADYPTERMRIVVADDGSTDRTAEVVRGLHAPQVRLMSFAERRGKIHVQHDALQRTDTDIVVLTDATVRTEPGVVRTLVAHVLDEAVGGASARIRVANPRTNWLVELHRLLFQIQNGEKAGECRLDSAGGLYGQCSAIKRSALGEPPTDAVYEDREYGIRLRERGYRVVLADAAYADYLVPETVADFRAQKRRIAGAMTESIGRHRTLLFNGRYGWYGRLIFPEYALFRVLRQPLLGLAGVGLLLSLFSSSPSTVWTHGAGGAATLLLSFWGGSLCVLPYLDEKGGYLRRLVTALPGMALLAMILASGSLSFLRRGQSAAWARIQRNTPNATDSDQP